MSANGAASPIHFSQRRLWKTRWISTGDEAGLPDSISRVLAASGTSQKAPGVLRRRRVFSEGAGDSKKDELLGKYKMCRGPGLLRNPRLPRNSFYVRVIKS